MLRLAQLSPVVVDAAMGQGRLKVGLAELLTWFPDEWGVQREWWVDWRCCGGSTPPPSARCVAVGFARHNACARTLSCLIRASQSMQRNAAAHEVTDAVLSDRSGFAVNAKTHARREQAHRAVC